MDKKVAKELLRTQLVTVILQCGSDLPLETLTDLLSCLSASYGSARLLDMQEIKEIIDEVLSTLGLISGWVSQLKEIDLFK